MENIGEQNIGKDVSQAVAENELEQVAGGKSSPYLRYECRICGAVSRNEKELKAHLRIAHPNDPRARY